MAEHTAEAAPIRLQAAIYATAFFTGNLNQMMAVVMPLWALELGATPFMIGVIISSRQIFAASLSIHGGALLDRFGARPVMAVLGLAAAASLGLVPVIPFIWATIALQMVSGFAETTNWVGTQSLIGRLLQGRSVYAGRMTATARVGGFFAPLLTGLAWQFLGPFGGFGFITVWIVCGVFIMSFLPDPAPVEGEAEPPPAARGRAAAVMPRLSDYTTSFRLLLLPAIALVIAVTFLRQTGAGIQTSFYGVWLSHAGFGGATIGLLVGVANACAAGGALSIGPITRRFTDHWALIASAALAIIAIAITPLLSTLALLFAAMAFRGACQGLSLPILVGIAARAVGLGLQGRVAALRQTFNRFGGLLVPVAMGALAEFVGLENAFYLVGAGGVALVAALGVWVALTPGFSGGSRH